MPVFLISIVCLTWVLVGWPLWLKWRAVNWPRPFRTGGEPLSVSMVICVRNGEAHLRRKLESIFALDYPHELLEVLVVSDGSTDRTDAIAGEFSGQGVKLLRVPFGGKPAALNAALEVVGGEILLITDVRQVLEQQSVRRLIAGFADPQVGVISGELLFMDSATNEEANIGSYRKFENWIRRQLTLVDSMLGATGCFYAIRRKLARPLPPETLLDDVYIPMGAFFAGYRLVAEPEARVYDYPTSLATEFPRKVRTLAGNYQLLKLYPQLLGPKNRMWTDFVSYKLGRLMMPYLLLALLISSFWLPPVWREAFVGAQLAGYGMATIDGWLPEGLALKKVTALARTFGVMMLAALCATSVLFVPAQRLWMPTQMPVKKA